MYLYLYDNFLKQRKYQSLVKSMETRLTDFGIAGKIIRLQHFTNIHGIIDDELKKGVTTIVIVGNDRTYGHVLSRAATLDVVFGFIPMGPENTICHVLGIPEGIQACEYISKRRKVELDVGWFNNRYFVSQLHIPLADIRIEYDDLFAVSSKNGGLELVVCNLQPFSWKERGGKEFLVHPQDGKLEAFLRPLLKKGLVRKQFEEPSIFPFEEMIVTGKKAFTVIADGKQSKESKITIRLAKKRIQMIVGRNRKF